MKLKLFPKIILSCVLLFLCLSFFGCKKKQVKEKVIQLSVWASEQDYDVLSQIIKKFQSLYENEAKFQITISSESESTCKDTVLLAPEAAADIFSFSDDQFAALLNGGALDPVAPEFREEVIENHGGITSPAIQSCLYKDILCAYPAIASNGYFLYYNTNFFTEEDVLSLDRILEITDKSRGRKFAMDLSSGWYLYSFYKSVGLDIHKNPDGLTNTCEWNKVDAEVSGKDVTESLINYVKHDGFASMTSEEIIADTHASQMVIACISGIWNEMQLRNAFGRGYGATKLPSIKVNNKDYQMHSVVGYKLIGVNAHSAQKGWAHKLANFITNEENQLLRFRLRGECPSNVTAANSPAVNSSVSIKALKMQSEFGHKQDFADSFWSPAYRFGNIIASGNVENYDIQNLLDQFVEDVSFPENF